MQQKETKRQQLKSKKSKPEDLEEARAQNMSV